MCVHDIRLGRLIRPKFNTTASGSASPIVLGVNQDRIAILVSQLTTSNVLIQFNVAAFTSPNLIIQTEQQPFLLSLMLHGDLPMRSMVIATTAAIQLDVIEFFLPEAVLAENPPGPIKGEKSFHRN